MPSLPATDDGSARPLAEDPGTGYRGDEDITGEAGPEPGAEAARADGGSCPAEAEPRVAEAEPRVAEADTEQGAGRPGAEQGAARPGAEQGAARPGTEQGAARPGTEQGAARPGTEPQADEPGTVIAPPGGDEARGDEPATGEARADGNPRVNETGTDSTTRADARPPAGESGRWFRPAKANAGYLEIPADGPDIALPDAESQVAAAEAGSQVAAAEAGSQVAAAEAGSQVGTRADERPEQREAAVKPRISRRTVLQASLIGGAGVAALPLLALVGDITRARNQPTDLVFSMNTNWLFGGPYTAGSESSFYDDSGFAPVTVPHTVTQLSWQHWDFPAWQHVWIYRRHFSGGRLLDSHRPGNRILVDFDGIMVNASVVINDQVAGTHRGGYLPFSAELTGKVTGGDNLLAVIVDSRCLPVPPIGVGRGPRSVDFFQPGGIYRDVRLRVLPQVFLSDLFAQPAGVLSPQPRVDVECAIDSAATTHASGTLLVELFDGSAQIAAQVANVNVSSPGISTARLSLTGFGPVGLWSPDSPKLYTVQATLRLPGLGSHVLTRRIGFREAVFRPEGFFLNGKRLQLFGLNRHQLYPYAGMAMGARVQRKDAEILKDEFNCNMVRCSHYPQSPDFLDACDELGLLVWEEAPGWHNVSLNPAWQDLVVQDVRDMVIRDRSRPSVVIWGTRLNETRDFPILWAATRRAARELDSSRPSSGAMAFHEDVTWDEDVFAYNDYGTQDKTGNIALKPPLPGLPYLVTEAVGVEAAKPRHFAWTDPPAWLARQAALHGQAQSRARSNPGYAGLLAWAGFDYASMLGPGPYDIKWAGVADGFRVPKPGAAIYQTQGDPAVRPVIIPVFFWEPGGAVPAPNPTAMIASNCDQLEVFIGGTHVASARPASGSPLYRGLIHPPFLVQLPGHLPKPAPELLVQGLVGGRPVAQLRMSANPGDDALVMAVDDTTISADGSDATRAVFRAVDAHGNQRRYGSGQVMLTLSGPATLVGDNPFAFGQYGGLGAVWIRSQPGQPGAITLTASHPLLGQAEIQVRSEQAKMANELL